MSALDETGEPRIAEHRSVFRRAPLPRRPARFSALTRRIIFFNAIVLLILLGGVIFVQSTRVGLIDERLAGIKQQALIVAGTLAEYTTDDATRSIKVDEAEPLLRQLIAPTSLRARLYGTDGALEVDTRNLLARNIVQTYQLPPVDFWSRVERAISRVYNGVMGVRPFAKLEPYFEAGKDGRVYSEVVAALSGKVATKERVDEKNRLVLSVAVPVQRFRAIYGVLMVSTEGGDIDGVLREERATLMEVFLVGFVVMLISSLYLAGFIAEPIRRLAAAADRVRRGRAGRETIPQMNERNDEIGELADSLSAMTRALYDRIDAIESFAADVAHELKNPLTSLRSAVETLPRATKPEQMERLTAVIQHDVRRLDRLISDISNASRLDAELAREAQNAVDLDQLLSALTSMHADLAGKRKVSVVYEKKTGKTPPLIIGHDSRLAQVVSNLLDNAVSFSPEGGTVTACLGVEGEQLVLRVTDEGPGIKGDVERIFQRFYTDRPETESFGDHSGLGLSISQQIVQAHKGTISAENRQDRAGATFTVRLPRVRK